MCNCPIETRFDDNEFLGMAETLMFSNGDKDNYLYSESEDEEYFEPVIIYTKVTLCPECDLENERLAGIETLTQEELAKYRAGKEVEEK